MKLQIFALVFCVAVASAADSTPNTEIHSVIDLAAKVYNDVNNEMGKDRSAMFTARDFMRVAELKYLTPEGRILADSVMENMPDFSSIFRSITSIVSSVAAGASGSAKGGSSVNTPTKN